MAYEYIAGLTSFRPCTLGELGQNKPECTNAMGVSGSNPVV